MGSMATVYVDTEKVAPNFTNSLVIHEFGCAIFQTADVLMYGKLSVVKLEAGNRLEVWNF